MHKTNWNQTRRTRKQKQNTKTKTKHKNKTTTKKQELGSCIDVDCKSIVFSVLYDSGLHLIKSPRGEGRERTSG
jgi:hypothetical protein